MPELKEVDDTTTSKKRKKRTSIAVFSDVKDEIERLILETQPKLSKRLSHSDFIAILLEQFKKEEKVSLDNFIALAAKKQQQLTSLDFENIFRRVDTTSNVKRLLEEIEFSTEFIKSLKSDIARPNTRRLLLCILHYIFEIFVPLKKNKRGRPPKDKNQNDKES